ncbi:type III-A CRISPR-associated protein Csm2 [Rhodoferax antarcticus]|uniref:type III-A CRISPR-associated protein Csm2 n=1 Tax=Rhodoferax antarcticus TaxID=81479 RepID=UPI0022250C5A|nr:type III-A CRISPR-associated protein Csm2 [Rhodoferax antarcticus]MCW2313119.1 CRISPR-associated protein Csm2 [Rhodoferax antarcticus]
MASNYGAPRQTGWGNDRQAAPRPTISVNDIVLASPVPVTLFCDIAQDKAASVFQAGDGRKNKSTQLRKFYDELVMWFDKVQLERTKEARASKYAELAPFIKMMNAKVAYARGRDHVDECFEQMFSHLIRQITDAETLKHAKLFMEAFMGFYKAQEK